MKHQTLQKELWLAAYHWLKQCGSDPNKDFCRDEITGHPDYPSLLAITDCLDRGGFSFQAVKADASYIHEFNYPLLAHIKEPGNEYLHMISGPGDWVLQKEFTDNWTGVVLYPDKDARWDDADNAVYRRDSMRNRFVGFCFSFLGLMVFGATCFAQHLLLVDCFGCLSLLGIVISVHLLGTELGFESRIVKQVCGGAGENGCLQVLKSKYAKGIWGVTPADISVIYFSWQFAVFTIGAWYNNYLPVILFSSIAGPAVAAWSIYTQAYKIKKWCAFCLVLVVLLVLQAVISFLIVPSSIGYLPGIISTAILFLFFITLISIRRLLQKNNTYRSQLTELRRWKGDGQLFLSQWQQGSGVSTVVWDHDLVFGKQDAPVTITVACSPYCKPCAHSHAQLDEMLRRFDGKIRVVTRFVCFPEKEDSMITMAVAAILQKAGESGQIMLHRALSDWFASMDLEKWRTKWEVGNSVDVKEMLIRHSEWIKENDITYTPTIFLNGRRVPGRYRLEDIALLIPQLSNMEEMESLSIFR